MDETRGNTAGSGGKRPVIGVTADVVEAKQGTLRATCGMGYVEAIARAGGVPMILAPTPSLVAEQLDLVNGVVLTGGDDPRMEGFGVVTDARATPVHELRQAYEIAVLDEVARRKGLGVLGVCLGMQYMALHAGGTLAQWMADEFATAEAHWGNRRHAVNAEGDCLPGGGTVTSHHRQAVTRPGKLKVAARAEDGVIEAVWDPARAFYVGVQWHPERTEDDRLGQGLFDELVRAAAL